MAFPVTLNGTTYTLADFEGTNYVDGFPNALEDFVTQAGDIYNSTSTSSVAIGTGSKSFTTADSGKPYQEGTPLRIADAAAPETNFMDCIVTSYSGTSLVVESIGFGGSGTKSSWTINIGGAKTVDGTLAINQGGTGATTASAAASNLGLGTEDSPEFTGLTVTSSGDFSGATISDLGTVTTADINGGSVDGATLGTNSAITEAQIDNINIDGNAITSTDTNGDITISPDGTGTVVIDTDLDVDNININGNAITSTDTNGNIALTPDGTGEVDISKVDIDSGTIDDTTIGGSTPAAGSFTTITGSGDMAIDTDTLFVDVSENRVGVGTTSPDSIFTVARGATSDWSAKFHRGNRTDQGIFTDGTGILLGGTDATNGLTAIRIYGDNVDSNNYKFIRFDTYGAERARIDSSGTLIHKAAAVFNEDSNDADFRVESDANTHALFVDAGNNLVGMFASDPTSNGRQTLTNSLYVPNGYVLGSSVASSTNGEIRFMNYPDSSNANFASIRVFASASKANTTLVFDLPDGNTDTSPTERFRITRDNVVANEVGGDQDFRVETNAQANAFFVDAGANNAYFGKGTTSTTTDGIEMKSLQATHPHMFITYTTTQGDAAGLYINRQTNDGDLVAFRQANSREGTISVSGATVSYNGFSGNHESSGIPTTTQKGTVVSTIDELDVYLEGPKQGQTRTDHAKVEVSNTVSDPAVYGVISHFNDTGKAIVTSVGIGSVLVTGACAKGDLLESNGDGTARVQDDDIVRSKTIGKVTIGNSDTGVKLVSCVMYCG